MDIFWKRFSATQNFPSEQRVIFFAEMNAQKQLQNKFPEISEQKKVQNNEVVLAEQSKVKNLAEKALQNNSSALQELGKLGASKVNKILESAQFDENQKKKIINILNGGEQKMVDETISSLKKGKKSGNVKAICAIPPSRIFAYLKDKSTIDKRIFLNIFQNSNVLSPFSAEAKNFVKFLDDSTELQFLKNIVSPSDRKLFLECFLGFKKTVNEAKGKIVQKDMNEKTAKISNTVAIQTKKILEENVTMSDKEAQMIQTIRNTLGKEAAQKAQKNAMQITDSKKRLQAYLESAFSLQAEHLRSLLLSKRGEISEIVGEWKIFWENIVRMTNLSESKKQDFLADLHETEQEVQEMFATFDPNSNEAEWTKERRIFEMFAQKGTLSDAEKTQIQEICQKKAIMEQDLYACYAEYESTCAAIFDAVEAEKSTKSPEEILQPFFGENVEFPLTQNAFERLRKELNDDRKIEILPEDFVAVHRFGEKYALQMGSVKALFRNPHHFAENGLHTSTLGKMLEGERILARTKDFALKGGKTQEKLLQAVFNALKDKSGKYYPEMLPYISPNTLQKDAQEVLNGISPQNLQHIYEQTQAELQNFFTNLKNSGDGRAQNLAEKIAKMLGNGNQNFAVNAEKFGDFQKKMKMLWAKMGNEDFLRNVVSVGFDVFPKENLENVQKMNADFLEAQESTEQLDAFFSRFSRSKNILENKNLMPEKPPMRAFVDDFSEIFENFLEQKTISGETLLELKNPKTGGKYIVEMPPEVEEQERAFLAKRNDGEVDEDALLFFDSKSESVFVSANIYEKLQANSTNIFTDNNISDFLRANLLHENIHLICKYNTNAVPKFENFLGKFSMDNGRNLLEWVNARLQKATTGEASKMEELLAILAGRHSSNEKLRNICATIIGYVEEGNLKNFLRDEQKIFSMKYLEESRKNGMHSIRRAGDLDLGEETVSAETKRLSSEERREKSQALLSKLTSGGDMESAFSHLEEMANSIVPDLSSENKKFVAEYIRRVKEHADFDRDFIQNNVSITKEIADDIIGKYSGGGLWHKKISDLSEMISEETSHEEVGYLGSVWKNTEFLSMNDLGLIWGNFVDYVKKRFDIRQKRRVGTVGHNLFKGTLDGLANDFDQMVQNADSSAISDIKGALDNKPAVEIKKFLKAASNPDELKAALLALADKGEIDWSDTAISLKLSELGCGIRFYPPDFENMSVRDIKYDKAFTNLYDDPELFQTLLTKNDGSYGSSVKSFEGEASARGKNCISTMEKMLRDHVRSHKTDGKEGKSADAARYEAYVRQLIEQGSGSPTCPIYYFVAGVVNGIIPHPYAMKLADGAYNGYPAFQYFSGRSLAGITEDYKNINALRVADEKHKDGSPIDEKIPKYFNNWVFSTIMKKDNIYERTVGNLAQGKKFDHDHGQFLASIGDAMSADAFLGAQSTGAMGEKKTIYTNAIAGMMESTTAFAIGYQDGHIKKDEMKLFLQRQMGYFTNYNGLVSNRIPSTKSKVRFTDDEYQSKPREGGNYNGDMTTANYIDAMQEMFATVGEIHPQAKVFFDMFYDKTKYPGNSTGRKKLQNDWKELRKIPYYQDLLQKIFADSITGIPGDFEKDEDIQSFYLQCGTIMKYYLNDDVVFDAVVGKIRGISKGSVKKEWANVHDRENPANQK